MCYSLSLLDALMISNECGKNIGTALVDTFVTVACSAVFVVYYCSPLFFTQSFTRSFTTTAILYHHGHWP